MYCKSGNLNVVVLNHLIVDQTKIHPAVLGLVPIHSKLGQISEHTPVLGQIQLRDVRLDEGSVAVVTVVLPVLLHKVFHEIHSSNVFGFGQQVASVAAAETHGNTYCQLDFLIDLFPLLRENAELKSLWVKK